MSWRSRVLTCVLAVAHAQNGLAALIVAARNGHMHCVLLLLNAGADKHAKDHVRVCRRGLSGSLKAIALSALFAKVKYEDANQNKLEKMAIEFQYLILTRFIIIELGFFCFAHDFLLKL